MFSFATIFSGGAPNDFSQADTNTNGGEQSAQQYNRWWLVPRVIYWDDTAAQWIMMFATIFAAYLLLRTLWATQKMASDTQRIGEAGARAWVSNDGWTLNINAKGMGEPVDFFAIKFTFGNFGNTPALEFNAQWMFERDDQFGVPVDEYPFGKGSTIGPNVQHTKALVAKIRPEELFGSRKIPKKIRLIAKYRTIFDDDDRFLEINQTIKYIGMCSLEDVRVAGNVEIGNIEIQSYGVHIAT